MQHGETSAPLRHHIEAPSAGERFLHGANASVAMADPHSGTCLGGRLGELARRSVLLAIRDQFPAALALIELDGVARRIVLCPPDLAAARLPEVAANAEADAVVSDRDPSEFAALAISLHVQATSVITPVDPPDGGRNAGPVNGHAP